MRSFFLALFAQRKQDGTDSSTTPLLKEGGSIIVLYHKRRLCMNSMTYRLKPVDCMGRERPLRLKVI